MNAEIAEFLKSNFDEQRQSAPYGDELLREFLLLGPLHTFIPTRFGGSMTSSKSYLEVVEHTSYYSLPLGLTLGISGSLFLQPVCRHAEAGLRQSLVQEFLRTSCLGGIMITEPSGGTDVMGIATTHKAHGGSYRVSGSKCWAGLTGLADHWLVASRKEIDGRATKMLALSYVPRAAAGIQVAELFDALGLQPIPYGRTELNDVQVQEGEFLTPPGGNGLRAIYDTVFRSRMGISAMVAGMCRRLFDDLELRCADRVVFGKPLAAYDQVRFRQESMQGYCQVNRALWHFAGDWMDAHDDVSTHNLLANCMKVVSSESMAVVADSAVQLYASAAYRASHYAGRAYVDARPFRIFEGTNDVLNDNISESIVRGQGGISPSSIRAELARSGLELPESLPAAAVAVLDQAHAGTQRNRVMLGAVVARACVLAIVEQSAHLPEQDRASAVAVLRHDLSGLAGPLSGS